VVNRSKLKALLPAQKINEKPRRSERGFPLASHSVLAVLLATLSGTILRVALLLLAGLLLPAALLLTGLLIALLLLTLVLILVVILILAHFISFQRWTYDAPQQ
jgi:hypothetical protein